MMNIWSWICELPDSNEWVESDSPLVFELATSKPTQDDSTRSIQLRAEQTSGSNTETLVTFSVCLQGFHPFKAQKTLWVSDTCPLSSDKPFLPLLLQLLQEIISRSPTANNSTCPRSQLQKLKPDPVLWIMDSHSPEMFSSFFNLVFLTRLFWLCVCDAPSEVGSLYFHSLLAPNLEALSFKNSPVLRTFLTTVGVDAELCFMRTLGYMLAKWLILREVGVGLQTLTPSASHSLGFSYAMEAHGLWVLKGYTPLLAMKPTRSDGQKNLFFPIMETKESLLRYALAHQQLEAVFQFEYSVGFYDGYIQVKTRVDNLRFHVAKLGYNKNDSADYDEERYFPSRIRVWVGPEVGATYVGGLSLGRSTDNGDREVETHRTLKGNFGKSEAPGVKATARTSWRTRIKNWRWHQDAEGNAAIFNAVLQDKGERGALKRHGVSRAFTKSLVFARDEYGEEVEWRLGKEMEGSVLKWRIGGEVWLSYLGKDEMRSSCFEDRSVEWCDEVDLPLIPAKFST